MEKITKVYVLFKTHFDYGYTAMARDVYERYMNVYIPAALSRAEETRGDGKRRFVWITGSWLIDEFLRGADEANRARMENAIRLGDVRWHGLPFTTHTELMDRELFEYGISISKRLDALFGTRTTAAKMTDVPGHTRAIIDPLADAGIKLMHIGDNPTSRAPEIPEIFNWRAPSGKQITVIYSMGYGQNTLIPGTGALLYFAHTGDNAGPQSRQQIQSLYARLENEYPGAEITVGTLEDIARETEKISANLPVITREIGDTWIHGVGSDPRKISEYRAMLRLREAWPEDERMEANRCLIRVPEHTWGSFLDPIMNDRQAYARKDFEKLRGEERYRFMEDTWREQRGFVRETLAGLSPEHKAQALTALSEYDAPRETLGVPVATDARISKNGWSVRLDSTGAICELIRDGCALADAAHRLGEFRYEVFSRDETDRFARAYIETRFFPNLESISWELFDKPGIQCAIDAYASAGSTLAALRETEGGLQADMEIRSELVERFGCPAKLTLDIELNNDCVKFYYRWSGKAASRVPEGLWLGMNPLSDGYLVRKLGEWIDPMDIVKFGNRHMCATDWGVKWRELGIESLDAAVVAFSEPALWRFDAELPKLAGGAWFNLFNNMWNTNFPMWYDEDALFRFELRLTDII